ncbi:MAG: ATP-dependent sacrificial sulfur transferase LarE [Gemmatimonadales bacterium]
MTASTPDLAQWFERHESALLGYSGGVDSAVLAVVGARALGERFLAVLGRSASLSEAQLRQARSLAASHRVPLLELATAELDDSEYRRNAPDRCFFCKRELWSRLSEVARARGLSLVVDGTNADDLGEHRPGHAAGERVGVRSPLAELGWTKARVRDAARGLGLPIWDAPAAPCLASRVRYGVAVTEERLGQVERAEAWLRDRGIEGNLRVRHHGSFARIEVDPPMFARLEAAWAEVTAAFGVFGFERVERDPAGYRRGSLLAS